MNGGDGRKLHPKECVLLWLFNRHGVQRWVRTGWRIGHHPRRFKEVLRMTKFLTLLILEIIKRLLEFRH